MIIQLTIDSKEKEKLYIQHDQISHFRRYSNSKNGMSYTHLAFKNGHINHIIETPSEIMSAIGFVASNAVELTTRKDKKK